MVTTVTCDDDKFWSLWILLLLLLSAGAIQDPGKYHFIIGYHYIVIYNDVVFAYRQPWLASKSECRKRSVRDIFNIFNILFLYRQPWLASKSECPTCRVPALELRRLRIINNAVEKLAVRGDNNNYNNYNNYNTWSCPAPAHHQQRRREARGARRWWW